MPITNERIVWIDCEMTGLDTKNDALIEVAALVTDSELNILGDGVDVVIKPDDAALAQMNDFVRDMHTRSGLLEELPHGKTMAEAEAAVMEYIAKWVPDPRKAPLAGNSVGTDRVFLARDMPSVVEHLHYRVDRREHHQGTVPALVRPRLLPGPRQARRPPRARGHQGFHRRTPLLPGGRLCPRAGAGQRHRPADLQADIRPASTADQLAAERSSGGRGGARKVICATFGGNFARKSQKWQKHPRTAGKLFDVAFPDDRIAGQSAGHMVGVAQLAERLVVVQEVAGSTPVAHPHEGRQ